MLARKDNSQTFGADEAPADVDVTVVAVALLGVEVVGADDGRVGDHLAACRHTQVAHMVRHRAAKATHQPACNAESTTKNTGSKTLDGVVRLLF